MSAGSQVLVDPGRRSRGTADRPLWLAAVAWTAVVVPPQLGVELVDALLLLAVVVTVPAAAALHPDTGPRWTPLGVAAGLPVLAAAVLPQGTTSGLLVLPWLTLAVALAARDAWRWLTVERTATRLLWATASAYLVVGALWLLAHRLALEPAGFGPPYVALTAVHFHHAGTLALALTLTARRWRPADRTLAAASWITAAGPPLVAVGFLASGLLQILGAAVMTTGLYLLAWVTWRRVRRELPSPARALLTVMAISVVVPMLLAVQWAVGTNLGTFALSVPAMAATHGVLNAFGVTLAGVLGWRQAQRDPAPPPRSVPS